MYKKKNIFVLWNFVSNVYVNEYMCFGGESLLLP